MDNTCFQFVKTVPDPAARIFCFHYAGGSAFFYADLCRYLSSDISVYPYQIAGRGGGDEPFETSIESASMKAAAAIAPYCDRPIFLLGHSMGGLLAFNTAFFLKEKFDVPTEMIFMTSSIPDLASAVRISGTSTQKLCDDEFCDALINFGAMDKRTMQIREFRQVFLPIIRADFHLVESYCADKSRKIDTDIYAYAGSEDKIFSADSIFEWQKYTTGEVNCCIRDGGHFFVKDCKKELYGNINELIHKRI